MKFIFIIFLIFIINPTVESKNCDIYKTRNACLKSCDCQYCVLPIPLPLPGNHTNDQQVCFNINQNYIECPADNIIYNQNCVNKNYFGVIYLSDKLFILLLVLGSLLIICCLCCGITLFLTLCCCTYQIKKKLHIINLEKKVSERDNSIQNYRNIPYSMVFTNNKKNKSKTIYDTDDESRNIDLFNEENY